MGLVMCMWPGLTDGSVQVEIMGMVRQPGEVTGKILGCWGGLESPKG